MVIFIEVLEGPLQGSRFKVEHGQRIGRTRGDIVIDDEKISGLHAQFELDNKGQYVLNDLNSSNGIVLGNRRVKKIALIPDIVFRIGRTIFKVVSVEEPEAVDFGRIQTWKENLAEKLPLNEIANEVPPGAGRSFSPTLKLKFVQGIQADESLLLGYGPRRAGACSLDIDLRDPEAPEQAFEIIPGEGVAWLKNLCKDLLTLNNQPIEAQVLHDGDLIRVGKTLIQVTYI